MRAPGNSELGLTLLASVDWGVISALVSILVVIPGAVAAVISLRKERRLRSAEVLEEARASERASFVEQRLTLKRERYRLPRLAADAVLGNDSSLIAIGGGKLLTLPEWIPEQGWSTDAVVLRRSDPELPAPDPPTEFLPPRDDGRRYHRYSEAMGALARPGLFEDWRSYRLIAIEVEQDQLILDFTESEYFHMIDTCESLAHEAYLNLEQRQGWEVRERLGTPRDLMNRVVIPSVNVLTIRSDGPGEGTFLLHERDGDSVAVAGSTKHVVPCGSFQPSCELDRDEDFDLWTCVIREYAEEFLGLEEAQKQPGFEEINYAEEEPYKSLNDGFQEGSIRFHILGVGIDPVTWVYEILAVTVFDGPAFDRIFGDIQVKGDEGTLLGLKRSVGGFRGRRLDRRALERVLAEKNLAPAAAGLVDIALKRFDRISMML